MRLLAGCFAVGLLLAGSSAEAWPWSKRPSLPKAIDYPIVRPKVKEHHKPGNRTRHPVRYERIEWGSEWDKVLDVKRPKELPSFLTQE